MENKHVNILEHLEQGLVHSKFYMKCYYTSITRYHFSSSTVLAFVSYLSDSSTTLWTH